MRRRDVRRREAPTAGHEDQVLDRATAGDLAYLAMDAGPVPQQLGVVLLLDGSPDLDQVRQIVDARIRAVPRLRQRLARTPPGCGRPIWVDDETFDIRQHVEGSPCPAPGDEESLLSLALSVVMTPLRRDRPLWTAVLITRLADGGSALVIAMHHVLSDGIGGLAVLANLVDPGPGQDAVTRPFPRSRPAARRLAAEALRERLEALRRVATWLRLLRESTAAAGGLRPARVASCSLLQRTGPRRRLAVVRVERERIRAAARRCGATTNDAVLVAIGSALQGVLAGRGESLDHVVVTVPVAGRRTNDGPGLGNFVTPIVVAVPTGGGLERRLREVASQVLAAKAAATGPPPIALLGWVFRPLAALGGYRWYMNHQHRFHTLVSHLRGPAQTVSFGGAAVRSAIPVAVAEGGNGTVYFEVLSYAGTLTVSVVVDPDRFDDLDRLVDALRTSLEAISRPAPVAP